MVNHNVRVTFAVRIADGVATGIWASSVLSTYINVLEGDNDEANEKVGYAQAIQGTFLAAAAIPAGWLAITHRRDSILKVMGLIAFAAIGTTSAALLLDVSYKYQLLCCGLALWGVAQANAPVLDALFADSVPTGNRSQLYTWLHMCYIVSQGIGPGVGALMFALNGNVWKLEVLQHVMLVGMALASVPALLMVCCFDDDKTLGAESEGLLRVALLRDHERDREDAEAATATSWGGRSPREDDGGDYRRPFLEGWSSEVEQDFRNQVSPACSPARPVLPYVYATAVPTSSGTGPRSGVQGNGSTSLSRHSAPHPHSVLTPQPHRSPAAGAGTASLTASPAISTPAADMAARGIAMGGPAAAAGAVNGSAFDQQLNSHAVTLSPTSMSPVSTDPYQSGWGTPTGTSPAQDGGYLAGADGAPASATAVAVAAAAGAGDAADGRENRGLANGGSDGGAATTTTSMAGRFHAVRQAVNGAAGTASAELGATEPDAAGVTAATKSAVDAPVPLADCRAVSIAGGTVPEIAAAAEAAVGIAAGAAEGTPEVEGPGEEGDGARGSGGGSSGGAAGGRASGESAPSELSFSSMLSPAGFKSTQGRTFNRTTSNSSAGSGRERGSGGGAAGGGGGGGSGSPPVVVLLPHVEEDPAPEAGVSDDPSTPTLEPRRDPKSAHGSLEAVPPVQPSAPQGVLPAPLAAAAAAAAAAAVRATRGRSSSGGGGSPVGDGAEAGGGWKSGPEQPPPRLVAHRAGRAGGAPGGVAGPTLNERRFLCLSVAWIPGVLALTDCIMGLASGMTIKFFPIFFKDEVELKPMYVNLMYCAIPLCLSLAALTAQRQSRVLGRVQTMVLNRGIGISVLYWIALNTQRWHQPGLMAPVYVVRTSIMNSIYPLQKSILMDFVPKERRAAWNSLESVTSFGWSGSAALGGWLIHKFGFRVTFLITATMQCMGWCMSMLLLPIVPRKELGVQEAHRHTAPAAAAAGAGGSRPAAGTIRGGGRPGHWQGSILPQAPKRVGGRHHSG